MARAHDSARVVPLDVADLALLPVTAVLADDVTPAALCALGLVGLPGGSPQAAQRRALLLTGPESGFAVLTPGLVALLEAGSVTGTVAYVEADYAGRDGWQTAAVWRTGRLVTGPLLLGPQEEFSRELAPSRLRCARSGCRRQAAATRSSWQAGRHRRTADWAPRRSS